MVKKSFELTVDGKTYQVEALRPGVLSIDGNVVNVTTSEQGVTINDEPLAASLSDGFAIVGGKLYQTGWQVK
jgi:hypothetical protein